jgi:hypothetical protein
MAAKTHKREVAVALLAVFVGLLCVTVWAALSADLARASVLADLTMGLSIPTFGFAATAFGLDWYAKQSPYAAPPPPPLDDPNDMEG